MKGNRNPRKAQKQVNTTIQMLKKIRILSDSESQSMQLHSSNIGQTPTSTPNLLIPPQKTAQSPFRKKFQNNLKNSFQRNQSLKKSLTSSVENQNSQIKKILRETLMISPKPLPACNNLVKLIQNGTSPWESWQFSQTAVTTPILEYNTPEPSKENVALVKTLQTLFMKSDHKYGSGLIQLQQVNQILENQQILYMHTLTEFLNGIMLLSLEILPHPSPVTHKLLLMSMMYKVGDSYSVNLVEDGKYQELKTYLKECLLKEEFRNIKVCEFFYLVWNRLREEFAISPKKDEETLLNLLGVSKFRVFGKKDILRNEFGLCFKNLIDILTDQELYEDISKSGIFRNQNNNTTHPIFAVVEAISKHTSFFCTFKLLFTLCVNDLRLPITINQDEVISGKEKLKLDFKIFEVRFKNKPKEVKEFFNLHGLKSVVFEFVFCGKRDMVDQIYSPPLEISQKGLNPQNHLETENFDSKHEFENIPENNGSEFEVGGMEDYLAFLPLQLKIDGSKKSSMTPENNFQRQISLKKVEADDWRDERRSERVNRKIISSGLKQKKYFTEMDQRESIANQESQYSSINKYLEELNPNSHSDSSEVEFQRGLAPKLEKQGSGFEEEEKKKKMEELVKIEMKRIKESKIKETMVSIYEEREKSKKMKFEKKFKREMERIISKENNKLEDGQQLIEEVKVVETFQTEENLLRKLSMSSEEESDEGKSDSSSDSEDTFRSRREGVRGQNQKEEEFKKDTQKLENLANPNPLLNLKTEKKMEVEKISIPEEHDHKEGNETENVKIETSFNPQEIEKINFKKNFEPEQKIERLSEIGLELTKQITQDISHKKIEKNPEIIEINQNLYQPLENNPTPDQIRAHIELEKENSSLWAKEDFTSELEKFLSSMEKNSQMVSFCIKPENPSKKGSFRNEDRRVNFRKMNKRNSSIKLNQFREKLNKPKTSATSDRDTGNWRNKLKNRANKLEGWKDNKKVNQNEKSISEMKSFLLESGKSKINTVENIEKSKKKKLFF